MRNPVAALALMLCVAVPQAASAEDTTPAQLREKIAVSSPAKQLPKLLPSLGVHLISKAHAAECIAEGETCTSNEQCCSGLECSGGPPATCAPED
jgi:hypothetical protein